KRSTEGSRRGNERRQGPKGEADRPRPQDEAANGLKWATRARLQRRRAAVSTQRRALSGSGCCPGQCVLSRMIIGFMPVALIRTLLFRRIRIVPIWNPTLIKGQPCFEDAFGGSWWQYVDRILLRLDSQIESAGFGVGSGKGTEVFGVRPK